MCVCVCVCVQNNLRELPMVVAHCDELDDDDGGGDDGDDWRFTATFGLQK